MFFSPDGGKTVLISTSSLEIPGPVLKLDTKPFVYPSAPTNQKYTLVDCKHNYRFVRFEQHRRVDEAPHTIYCCTICNHLILKATNSKDTSNSENTCTTVGSNPVALPQSENQQKNQLLVNTPSEESIQSELIDNSSIREENTVTATTSAAVSVKNYTSIATSYNQLTSYDEDIDNDDDDDVQEDDYDFDD